MSRSRVARTGASALVAGGITLLSHLVVAHADEPFADAGPDAAPDAAPAPPDPPAPPAAEVIDITQTAPAEAASSVHFSAADLARRPHASSSDLLRQTPGLVVAQHAGGGKADQLFLRGFDADHGTDVAIFVDGVPANMTSHGHGQGYADTHWVIPETVATIDVHKGPYSARFGDFNSAGAVEMGTLDEVPGLRLSLTGGLDLDGPAGFVRPSYRIVGLGSPALAAGKALLAGEIAFTDGPFVHPQDFRRVNALGKWAGRLGGGTLSLATTFYAARWNQSGQVPAAEVDAGRLGRFASLDPSEGGASSRSSLRLRYQVPDQRRGRFTLEVYAVDYRLRLHSNFTLYARDPVNGDQIEQTDARTIWGANGSYTRAQAWRGVYGAATLGVQLRSDDVDASLWHDRARVRLPDCFDAGANPCSRSLARVRDLAAFAEEDALVTSWLQVIGGVRFDLFVWDVDDVAGAAEGGIAQRAVVSPKLSFIFRPVDGVEAFVNGGLGFHSNDARAAVSSRGDGAIARAYGAEVGARVRPLPRLHASVAAWYLYLTSEQVWNGDEGGTEPSEPSRRLGLDVDTSWDPTSWLAVDANVALARPTLVSNAGNGGALALAPRLMGGGGVSWHQDGSLVSLRARGLGARPANDDGSLTAEGYLILDLVASQRLGLVELGLTVNNLLDADWREAQFAQTSRVSPTAPLREDIHFTPGTPLTALVSATVAY